jgi:hypothetical protein
MYKLSAIIAAVFIATTAAACSSSLKPSVRKDIEVRMKSKHDRYQACYQQALAGDRDLEGHLTMKFTVDKDGRFDGVQVTDSSLRNRELEECVVSQTSGLRLSKGDKKEILVSYQLNFERRIVSVSEQ